MCGIIGYIGKREAQPILLHGLKRLEYRGYDSSGMAVVSARTGSLGIRKCPGKIICLEEVLRKRPLSGVVGIAHTRWATHGAPTQANAHPHLDCQRKIVLVHNGIIENHELLKEALIKEGHVFHSSTDTEVIVHLIEKFYHDMPLEYAVRKALKMLVGSFAIAVLAKDEPGKLIGARQGSPLIVGVGEGENFLASDVPAFLDSTKRVKYLEDNQVAVLTKESVSITDLEGRARNLPIVHVPGDISQAQKGGFRHFMLKEIHEQPNILRALLSLHIKPGNAGITFDAQAFAGVECENIRSISIVACGTAYHAGLVGKYLLESLSGIPTAVDVSSEFRYRDLLLDRHTLVIAVSQSGETADTLAGVREARRRGAKVVSICNVVGSTLTRESDGVIFTHAGPEIGVASTKAYTAQLVVFYLLALHLARCRQRMSLNALKLSLATLVKIPHQQEEILKQQASIATLARRHAHFGSFLYLGRNINFPSALEGALKLKEISYIPAEGYAAGEMKHGPIALIDEYRAVVCVAPESKVYDKMVSNIQEIRSRKGKLIAIATYGDAKMRELTREVVTIPATDEIFSPLLVVIPLQLLAYHIALKRGNDVDQPRNLAKSVTVE